MAYNRRMTHLSLFACKLGHLESPYIRPSSGKRECRVCRRIRRRQARRAFPSMAARSAAKFGKPPRATTPHDRYVAAKRKRAYRAKLASGHQAHELND